MQTLSNIQWGIAFTVLVLGNAGAAEPSLTHLKPAGIERGTTKTIECFGKFEWPVKIDCPGAVVECLEEKGQLSVTIDADLPSDRVWLRLYDSTGASSAVPLLIGEVSGVAEIEPNNAPDEAQDIPAIGDGSTNVIVDGVLEKSGEVDGFAVKLSAGQTLVAVVDANTTFGSPMDAILQVALPDGTVIDENHDFRGLDPGLAFTAQETGTYIVRVFAWPSNPNQQIRYQGAANFVYRLTLTTQGYVTHAVEQFATVGSSMQVTGMGMRSPHTGMALRLALDERFLELDAEGGEVGFVRIPGVAGSARVGLIGEEVGVGKGVELFDASESTLALNSAVSGLLEVAGEEQDYLLDIQKDQVVQVVVESVSIHSDLVALATISDLTGKVLKQTSERGAAVDAKLTFKAPADGEYRLSVRDRFNSGGPRHYYRLTVRQPRSDFKLTVATDRFAATKDKPLEIPVVVQRTGGIGEPVGDISISVEGLPEDIELSPVVSSSSGDSAKRVTLKLSAGVQAFSGPIRIIGKSAGGKQRSALAPASYGASFERLWLTLPAGD